MIDLTAISIKIENARKEKGFTQEELAVRLGLSSQAVSKWERGLSIPDIETLLDLTEILDISIDSLLTGNEQNISKTDETAYDVATNQHLKGNMYGNLITIIMGGNLISYFDSKYLACFSQLRTNVFEGTGVLLPTIRIMDDARLSKGECRLLLFGATAWSKNYEQDKESIQGDIINNVADAIYQNLSEFVNRHMVKLLIENLKKSLPFIVEGVIPERITLSTLRTVLKELVSDGVSIRNLIKIIEVMDELVEDIEDRHKLSEAVMARIPICKIADVEK